MISGDRVSHSMLGIGTITKIYPEGPTALVDFGYLQELLPVADLSVLAEQVAQHPGGTPRGSRGAAEGISASAARQPRLRESWRQDEAPIPTLSREAVEARRAVIALRLGQVLEARVSELSVGLAKVEQQLDSALAHAGHRRPTYLLVRGAWGGGKTHVLTVLEAAARRGGFVTSSVVMDGIAVTLSEPMQLMEAISNAMRFPSDALPGAIMHHVATAKARGDLERLGLDGTRILGGVFGELPRNAFENADVVAVLEDYLSLGLAASSAKMQLKKLGFPGVALPSLRAQRLSDRSERFCDLLHDWTKVCVAARTSGLVVILDELDVEYATTVWDSNQSLERRARRTGLLEALAGLRRERIPLLVAFAAAPAGAGVEAEKDASRDIARVLGSLDAEVVAPIPRDADLRELGKKVFQLYRDAYPEAFSRGSSGSAERIADLLVVWYQKRGNPVPRYFVRSMLEVMDVMSFASVNRR